MPATPLVSKPAIRRSLQEWLSYQQALHPRQIELGLERVSAIARRLGVSTPPHTLVTVAGSNGKGSCVAMLESILIHADYRVGSYTSPHILRYNERVRMQAQGVSDRRLCEAFEQVEAARGQTPLTYFEYGTLAAMRIFQDADLDVAILEVGLGGRLDAVNLQDPDLAVITGIALEHTDWLGDNRESIGLEKAGIMRPHTPVVCGDPDPPEGLRRHARDLGAPWYALGQAYRYMREGPLWRWQGPSRSWEGLPAPGLGGAIQYRNAATVLMALDRLQTRLPVGRDAIGRGLRGARLTGRFQTLAGRPETIVDIAHNPDAAQVLAQDLRQHPCAGDSLGVFSVLSDKDVEGMVQATAGVIGRWYLGELSSERALPLEALVAAVGRHVDARRIRVFDGLTAAYLAARDAAGGLDRIVGFGSAYCVSEILALHESGPNEGLSPQPPNGTIVYRSLP
jgi:dihydrofolate synthase/folylpolyglutamate synthase